MSQLRSQRCDLASGVRVRDGAFPWEKIQGSLIVSLNLESLLMTIHWIEMMNSDVKKQRTCWLHGIAWHFQRALAQAEERLKGRARAICWWYEGHRTTGTFSYHDPLHKTKAENLCKRPGGISFSLNCCFQLVQLFNLHLQQAKHCLAQMRGCEQEWNEWNSYTHCHCKGLKLSDLWTEILFRHLQQLSWDMFEGALDALATLKPPSSSAPSQKSWRGSTIPSFFFQPLGPDRFWKSFLDTVVGAQGESALRASPQAGCCRKTICSLRLTRLVNTQGGAECLKHWSLFFSMPKFSWPNSRSLAKRRLWMRGSFKKWWFLQNSSKFTRQTTSQTASFARRVALRRPGGAAAVFFFFEPWSSGRFERL